MTTFSHWIAIAYGNGVVKIYHTTTGALKLSLGPMDAIRAVGGSPDGSTLFCTHQENSITLWDIQTGGLIHDSTLTEGVQDIAISSKGHYLACRLSSGSIKVLEVANGVGDHTIWDSPLNTPFCWLQPEEQLVITDGLLVHIWDVVAGSIVHSFTVVDQQKGLGSIEKQKGVRTRKSERVTGMVYSQVHDRLAVIAHSKPLKGTVTIIHPQAATIFGVADFNEGLTCFSFSQTTGELVCGTQADGLWVLVVLEDQLGWVPQERLTWRHLELSHTVKCISSLPNGTVAVDSGNSGVKLLSLDNRYAQAPQLTLALTVSTFDQDRIVAFRSATHNFIQLLERSTMSNLMSISALDDPTIPLTTVLSASLQNRMVVRCIQGTDTVHLRLYRFGNIVPKWTIELSGQVSACGISQAGTWLLTFHHVGHATHICVWNTRNGQLQAKLLVDKFNSSPPHITFDSETRFHSHHDSYHVPYDLNFSPGADTTHPITRHKPQPWTVVQSIERQYEVESSREWVTSGSKRICWIPPGYIGLAEGDYYWVEPNILVMNGEDGTSRMFSFCL